MSFSRIFEILIPYLQILAAVSFATFLLSILLIPWYIGRMSENFFLKLQNREKQATAPKINPVLFIFRNCAGVILLAAGFVMLFLPGQGILTMLIGLLCLSFPGKRTMLIYLINRSSVQKSLNWTRSKIGKKPFIW